MTAVQVVLLVLGILAINALVLIPVLLLLKRLPGVLRAEMLGAGERPVRGPERASYQGATGQYSKVRGSGAAALTEQALIFRPLVGRRIEVPLGELTAVREDKWFRRGYRGGRNHLILKLKSGVEVAFMFEDHAGWMVAFRTIISNQ